MRVLGPLASMVGSQERSSGSAANRPNRRQRVALLARCSVLFAENRFSPPSGDRRHRRESCGRAAAQGRPRRVLVKGGSQPHALHRRQFVWHGTGPLVWACCISLWCLCASGGPAAAAGGDGAVPGSSTASPRARSHTQLVAPAVPDVWQTLRDRSATVAVAMMVTVSTAWARGVVRESAVTHKQYLPSLPSLLLRSFAVCRPWSLWLVRWWRWWRDRATSSSTRHGAQLSRPSAAGSTACCRAYTGCWLA